MDWAERTYTMGVAATFVDALVGRLVQQDSTKCTRKRQFRERKSPEKVDTKHFSEFKTR